MLLFPGEKIPSELLDERKCKLSQGVLPIDGTIVAVQFGKVKTTKSTISIQSNSKLYIPMIGDLVIGVVVDRHADAFSIDIGGAMIANLSMLNFEGASKRNKPNLYAGNVILALVIFAHKDMEVELTCIRSNGQANGLGLLSDGLMLSNLSASLCRYLSSVKGSTPLFMLLEKKASKSFSITSGSNNRILVDGENPSDVVKIISLIKHLNGLFLKHPSLVKLNEDTTDTNWNDVLCLIDALFASPNKI